MTVSSPAARVELLLLPCSTITQVFCPCARRFLTATTSSTAVTSDDSKVAMSRGCLARSIAASYALLLIRISEVTRKSDLYRVESTSRGGGKTGFWEMKRSPETKSTAGQSHIMRQSAFQKTIRMDVTDQVFQPPSRAS